MSELAEIIAQTRDRFINIAPPGIKYDSEIGFAIQLLKNNSYLKKIAESHPSSLQQAITNVAAIGLSLNPAKKQAYLITRNVKTDRNRWESRIFLEPSYMGLCDLATQSGGVEWIQASPVYELDKYQNNGPGEKPTHTYNAFSKDRGDFVGVYCLAKLSNGDYLFEEMTAEDIYSIRDRSESWKSHIEKGRSPGPWGTDFMEMAKKTTIRRAFKLWPKCFKTDAMESAVHISNENEGFERIVNNPQINEFNSEQKSYFDNLITNNNHFDMFIFSQTIPESTFATLYHSFEKGSKGKYQKIVDSLLNKGRENFEEIIDLISEGLRNNDDYAVIELIEDVSKDALGIIKDRMTCEQLQILNEIIR